MSPTFSLSSSTFSVRRKSSTRRFLNLGGDGCNRDVEGAAFDEGRLLQELEEDACYLEVEARLFAAAHAQRFVKAAAARDDIFCGCAEAGGAVEWRHQGTAVPAKPRSHEHR